jgi:NAD+ synthase (glutamine-hydrolysing)
MRIALAQNNYHTGNFSLNTEKMLASIAQAKAGEADLVVFAELAVCGYPPRDFLEFEHFLQLCETAVDRLATACVGIAAIVGVPVYNQLNQGKKLYNAAVLLEDGRVKQVVAKSLLPTYDVFDEYRYFEPAKSSRVLHFKGQKIALTICEDLWNIGQYTLYPHSPMDELILEKPDFIVNIAASPFSAHQQAERLYVLGENARKYQLPIVYVNHIGAQTELIFDGKSMVLGKDGASVVQLKKFEEDFAIVDMGALTTKTTALAPTHTMEDISAALTLGIQDYFGKLGFKKAILGLSGGIDSALVAVLAVQALGAENIHCLLMPSRYSSDHSIADSLALVKNIGVSYDILSIEKAFEAYETTLAEPFSGLAANITEENLQSRIRGMLLMAYTNKLGYILLNTSNKSELAVGYGTLYGDMCGGLSVIGDLYKTEVFALCRYINREKEIIPDNIITKPPSAELRPDQKDSDSLPDYELLDQILFRYIEERQAPVQIIEAGFAAEVVQKVMRLVNMNEYKRHQTPPILRVSIKAFGMGRRMPIVAKYLS